MRHWWDLDAQNAANIARRWPGRLETWDLAAAGRAAERAGFEATGDRRQSRFGVVVTGVHAGQAAVAKLDPNPDCDATIAALARLADAGAAPRLQHHDSELGVTICAHVGSDVTGHRITPKPQPAAALLRRLHHTGTGDATQPLIEFLRGRLETDPDHDAAPGTSTVEASERADAFATAVELQQNAPVAALHGDLSRGNWLGAHGRWWVTDPRPLAGDPAFDAAYAAYAYSYTAEQAETMAAAAGLDAGRVRDWVTVISATRLLSPRPS